MKSYKVIIIKDDTKQCETLMNQGWQLLSVLPHAKGALVVLVKDILVAGKPMPARPAEK